MIGLKDIPTKLTPHSNQMSTTHIYYFKKEKKIHKTRGHKT